MLDMYSSRRRVMSDNTCDVRAFGNPLDNSSIQQIRELPAEVAPRRREPCETKEY